MALETFEWQLQGETVFDATAQISGVREEVREYLVDAGGFDPQFTSRFCLVFEEATVNAIVHGNGEMSSEKWIELKGNPEAIQTVSTFAQRKVEVLFTSDPTVYADLTVTDEGNGFTVSAVPDPTAEENLDKPSGRGLLLIQTFCDVVEHREEGRQIYCRMNAVGGQVTKETLSQV